MSTVLRLKMLKNRSANLKITCYRHHGKVCQVKMPLSCIAFRTAGAPVLGLFLAKMSLFFFSEKFLDTEKMGRWSPKNVTFLKQVSEDWDLYIFLDLLE